jgi:hypothetical protein
MVPIQQQKWVAEFSVINPNRVDKFKHFGEQSDCNAGFWRSPVEAGDMLALKEKENRYGEFPQKPEPVRQ